MRAATPVRLNTMQAIGALSLFLFIGTLTLLPHIGVILTAFSQRDLIEQARDAGALAYLVKPFQRSELVPAVEVALGRFQEIKALHEATSNLEEQLETRKVVERAKGKLMDEHGMPEGDAFSFIQRTAMRERRTMKDIAQQVIDGSVVPPATSAS